jgi:anti-sigma28 factor (negative regulator of flagellin synthesis)
MKVIKVVFKMTLADDFDKEKLSEMKEMITSGEMAMDLMEEFEDLKALTINYVEL